MSSSAWRNGLAPLRSNSSCSDARSCAVACIAQASRSRVSTAVRRIDAKRTIRRFELAHGSCTQWAGVLFGPPPTSAVPSLGSLAVAQGLQAAERADVGGAVRAQREAGVVVVERQAGACELAPNLLAGLGA